MATTNEKQQQHLATLAGPGHYPSESDIALGAQALFDKEVAEHDAFRAAHPGPVAPAPRDTDAMLAELMQRVDDAMRYSGASDDFASEDTYAAIKASARKLLGETGAEALRSRDARIAELEAKLNTPQLHDFAAAVVLEATHQRERWHADHGAGKQPADWFWLLGYLCGKALNAATCGNHDKALHHTISTAAACANWHAAMTGEHTAMRPGIDPVARGIEPALRDAVQLPDMLAASEHAEPSGEDHDRP